MGGMGMMGGMGGPMGRSAMWLQGVHMAVGSLGQVSELLGMNADALQYAFGAFAMFCERIGHGAGRLVRYARYFNTPPPADAPELERVDPETGQTRRMACRIQQLPFADE